MNRKLGEHCGEPLPRKRVRGERVQFAATGEELARLARGTSTSGARDWTTPADAAVAA
ncbi:hypothetical protein GCM10009863_33680 [Streptomyces axinellae]|uniref:Uncharacterized protein n=2 Tax=Streptomyces axinellae TaxID=552788 RepID=A0ABP6CEA0_9ACTN